MKIQYDTTNFSSKVRLAHDTAEIFSSKHSWITKYGKQIKSLEKNGINDTVQISTYLGCKEYLDDTIGPTICLSVMKKIGGKIHIGYAYDDLYGAKTGKLPKGETNIFKKLPDLLKLYNEAVDNMEEVKICPSIQKHV